MPRRSALGYAHALLSAFWSAVMVALSKWSLKELDPVSLAALIMVIGAVAIALWLWVTRGWACVRTLRGAGWKWTCGLSSLFFFTILGSLIAIQMMDPTVVSFVSRTETLVAILLGVWLFGERFTRVEAAGAAFVVIGVIALRYGGGISIERGFWIILAASIGFGIAEAMAKKTVTIVDPFAFAVVRNTLLGLAFLMVAVVSPRGLDLPGDKVNWLAVACIGVSGPFLARVHFLKALQMIHISKTALVGQSQPIWVALLALGLLRQIPSEKEWVGGALVLAGCAMLIVGKDGSRNVNRFQDRSGKEEETVSGQEKAG